MKKGVFGGWFRELATLVFTQTVQAFLLAIVMTIIISAASQHGGSQNPTYAAGLLAIIALSQFNRIELLVKQIFGVTSQFGPSMESGKQGLLGAAMALRGVKRMGDNVGKVVGGTARRIKANSDLKNYRTQRDALESANEATDAENAAAFSEGAADLAMNTMDQAAGNVIKGAEIGVGMNAVGAGGSGASGLGVSSTQIQQLIEALGKQTEALNKSGTNGSNDKLSQLDAKIKEAETRKKEAGKQIKSGIAETAAVPFGLAAGAVVALGMGENVGKYAAIGGGIADAAGEKAYRAASGVTNAAIDMYDNKHGKVQRDRYGKKIRDDSGKPVRSGGNIQLEMQIKDNKDRRDSANLRKDNADYSKKIYDAATKKINELSKSSGGNSDFSVSKAQSLKKAAHNLDKRSNVNDI